MNNWKDLLGKEQENVTFAEYNPNLSEEGLKAQITKKFKGKINKNSFNGLSLTTEAFIDGQLVEDDKINRKFIIFLERNQKYSFIPYQENTWTYCSMPVTTQVKYNDGRKETHRSFTSSNSTNSTSVIDWFDSIDELKKDKRYQIN